MLTSSDFIAICCELYPIAFLCLHKKTQTRTKELFIISQQYAIQMLLKLQHSTKIWSHTTHRLMPLNIDSLYLVAALWKQWNQTLSIIRTSSDKWAARSQCFFHFSQMATDSTVQSSKQINSYRIVVITLLRSKFKNTVSICMNLSCVLCWYECLRFRYSFHSIKYTTELNQHKRSTLRNTVY